MSTPPLAAARADFFSLARWGYFLAAAVLAACSAALVRPLAAVQDYSQPIVGAIAWSYATKGNDYALLFSFVALFFAFLWLLLRLSTRIEATWKDGEAGFHDLLLLLCAPAGVWLAGLLATRSTSLGLLGLSGGLLLFGVVIMAILLRRRDVAALPSAPFPLVHKAIVLLFLCGLAVASVAIGIERLGAVAGSSYWLPFRSVQAATGAAGALGALALCAAGFAFGSVAAAERWLERCIVGLQFLLPAAFLLLVPQPWVAQGRLLVAYPMSPWAWAFIAACVVGAYANLVWHARGLRRAPAPSAVALLSIGSLVAILFLLKAEPTGAPSLWTDDYHSGESLVPWWSLARHHLVPFVDYTPARGLVNYVFGGLLELLFDGKASSYNAVTPFLYAALLWLALPAIGRTLGRGIAFLALLLFPYLNGISDIDLVVTAVLCVLWAGFGRWRPATWLGAWVLIQTALVLFAPGQGALATVAMAPLGLFMAYRMKEGETQGWKAAAAAVGALLVVAALTPLGPMVAGAIRYGMEQSSVNSIAHGVEWTQGFGKSATNPWLFELMRTSWLLAALWAGVLVWRAFRQDDGAWRRRVLMYALPILLLSVLFIVRAAGRIDADGSHSRLGLVSIWGVALLLPVLIFAAGRVRHHGAAVLVWLTIAGTVYGGVVGRAPVSHPAQFEPLLDPRGTPGWVQPLAALPQVGTAMMDPAHLQRLLDLRKVLDTVLGPDETYLDLSGRHATYFYFGRRPPIEAGSAYNLVTEQQQLRAIEAVRENPPPLVLILADNYVHDAGPASLRAHLLYRHLLLSNRYKVAQIGRYVWLVDARRVERLATLDVKSVADVNELADSPLRTVFAVPNLYNVPASWGRSAGTLERRLAVVAKVTPREQAGSGDVAPAPTGGFQVTGPDPYVRFDLAGLNLAGSRAGIVGFDFRCTARPGGPSPVIEIYWATTANAESELTVTRLNGRPGRLLVPLDAYPSWLLARGLKTIRFDVKAESCSSYAVDNVTLYQRTAARGPGQAAARPGVPAP